MEEHKTNWNEQKALVAAEEASLLSELLKREGFYKSGALKWLKLEHIEKFLNGMDEEEAANLLSLAADWRYDSDPVASMGLTHLDSLKKLNNGWRLLEHLATLKPAWITRWWKYNNKGGLRYGDDLLTQVSVPHLTEEEFQGHVLELTDAVVAEIIRRRPDLLDVMPSERLGQVLGLIVEGQKETVNLPKVLFGHGLPSNATAVIDGILCLENKSKHLELLSQLVSLWNSNICPDPVASTITAGNERLDILLHSPWDTSKLARGKQGDDDPWKAGPWYVESAIAAAVQVVPVRFRLEIGFMVGSKIGEEGREPSIVEVGEHLTDIHIKPNEALVGVVLPMAELWAALRTLARYEKHSWEHKTELVGLRAKIVSLATATPELWAQALPWILVRASEFGNIAQAVTLELASIAPEIHHALESACSSETESIRLKARGLQALLHGFENPDSGLARTLSDAAAHYIDGTPIFPHPLSPMSATWLCSAGVEHAITDGVRRASERFAHEVQTQGGAQEPALTAVLIKEIEVEFRGVQPRLKLMGTASSSSPVPILSVRQRPTSPQGEEPIYGCDLAWLLKATVRGRYNSTWVDLIQVKKSSMLQCNGKKRSRADSWKIDCKQLDSILKWSATAAYWLIASAGEVLVIPARYLEGIRRGTEKHIKSKSFTVGYHEIRSVAIPLEQYLVHLLIGQWVGTTSEDVVQFALGENTNIRPRLVVEVMINVGNEKQ